MAFNPPNTLEKYNQRDTGNESSWGFLCPVGGF